MIREFPIARVSVSTPYIEGEIEVMCMQEPISDLIIGNLPRAKEVEVNKERDNPSQDRVTKCEGGTVEADVTL